MIEQLWAALEDVQEILGELSAFYVEVEEDTGKEEAFKKSETIQKDLQRLIEAGQNAIKVRAYRVWRYAPASASLLGTRTGAVNKK